jgi:hypothetical protein
MGGAVKRHFLTSNFYPKSRSFSATFNEFASESASKIALFKMDLTRVGVLLMHPKMTHMFYARSSVSNGFTLVEASYYNFARAIFLYTLLLNSLFALLVCCSISSTPPLSY